MAHQYIWPFPSINLSTQLFLATHSHSKDRKSSHTLTFTFIRILVYYCFRRYYFTKSETKRKALLVAFDIHRRIVYNIVNYSIIVKMAVFLSAIVKRPPGNASPLMSLEDMYCFPKTIISCALWLAGVCNHGYWKQNLMLSQRGWFVALDPLHILLESC